MAKLEFSKFGEQKRILRALSKEEQLFSRTEAFQLINYQKLCKKKFS